MSYVEASFISRKEYYDQEEERLQNELPDVNELYIAMFTLVKNAEKREAAKFPCQFKDVIELEEEGASYLGSLMILNMKLEPMVKCVGKFCDGYWLDSNGQVIAVDTTLSKQYPPDESYVRDFNSELDSDLNITRASVLVPA